MKLKWAKITCNVIETYGAALFKIQITLGH